MGLVANTTDEFPTAQTVAEPPFSGSDCTNYPTIDELVEAESQAGNGATIRSGVAWLVRAIGDIQTSCTT